MHSCALGIETLLGEKRFSAEEGVEIFTYCLVTTLSLYFFKPCRRAFWHHFGWLSSHFFCLQGFLKWVGQMDAVGKVGLQFVGDEFPLEVGRLLCETDI